MHYVRFSTILSCSQEKAFDFHCDTSNLPLITPPWIDVQIKALSLPLHVKSTIDLIITRFGLPQRWLMEIETLQRPTMVVDRSLKSPFAYFRHEHLFEKIDEHKTMMVDKIVFQLPFWPLSFFMVPWIKKDLEKMFKYRHEKTKALLDEKDAT